MKTLIVGLGNPILGDDGVGWVVAHKIKAIIPETTSNIRVECFALAGISLMEQLISYQRVILIDSFNTGQHPQGNIVSFTLNELADLSIGHSASAHDLSLKKALVLGRTLNTKLPDDKDIHVIGIEAQHVYDFGETLTPAIEASIPKAVEEVMKLLQN